MTKRARARRKVGRSDAREWAGVFYDEKVPLPPGGPVARKGLAAAHDETVETVRHTGAILVIEDDPDVRDLLEVLLADEGHVVVTASDGVMALDLVRRGVARPDVIVADFNLPTGMDGVRATVMLRDELNRAVPAMILTGDISTATADNVALAGCERLSKPVKLKELTDAIQRLLSLPQATSAPRVLRVAETPSGSGTPVIYVVDDDDGIRAAIRGVLEDDGREVADFATCEEFLAVYRPGREACLVIDAYLPGMNGLALLDRLRQAGRRLPAIMITGRSDVAVAVRAMKAGAEDFIEKPISRSELLACVNRALELARDSSKLSAWREDAATHLAGLTPRERQIMDMVLAGHPSKNIAADLGISQRTVENHRASIMTKTGTRSLPALARLALAAVTDAD